MSVFSRFPARLQQAIVSRLGWNGLRPVQDLAGEAILDGKNCVVLAPTAGGKTEAAMFPILADLAQRPSTTVAALYIAPIKALLNNQEPRLGLYSEMVGARAFLWHGDVPQGQRKQFLREPAELLMTTPESLEVMLVSPKVPAARLFQDLRYVVVDEVHAMAGLDRGAHLMSVLERIATLSPHDIQRIGLSATIGNPEAILEWLRGSSAREGVVVDPPKSPAPREVRVHVDGTLSELATRAASKAKGKKTLFFCESRALTEQVAERMRDRGTDVFVHHSSVSLEERELAEERFARGGDAAIVCTSTLELGIDVGDLDLVFQAEAPATVSSFLQRMGRTGRREGAVANTTFFCSDPEAVLQAIALVELAREGWVESVPPQDRCWPALLHQLLALTLQFGGVSREHAWQQLRRVPDLRGVTAEDFALVVEHMRAEELLYESGGLLSMGDRAERLYGRKNFLELYAVFSSPVHYRVLTEAEREIGYLDQSFVDSLVEDMTSFLLGGRAWVVGHISHDKRTVTVRAAPRGKKPSWGRFAPKMLGFEVSQRIRRLLVDEAVYGYVHEDAWRLVEGYRDDFRALLSRGGRAVQVDDGGRALWWTFAGGRINHTLKYALSHMTGWKVVADNFRLRLEGDGITHGTVGRAIVALGEDAFWDDLPAWQRILETMPVYRLSKFQPALPVQLQREMVGRYLLDLAGTRRFLTGDASADLLGELLRGASASLAPVAPLLSVPEPEYARPERETRYIADAAALQALCYDLLAEPVVALDVETTLVDHELCLIQLGTPKYNALIDVLALDDLGPVVDVLESPRVLKIIHNAAFERSVFQRVNVDIANVFDTLIVSRELRGRKIEGGHSLAAVCQRELGITLDKSAQTSDWRRRPLSLRQQSYAALDVEVLIRLHERLSKELLFS